MVDQQILEQLANIQVDPDLIPTIRQAYTTELAQRLGHLKPSEREEIQKALRAVNEEEARAARLYAIGRITDEVWSSLWAEWQDRRHNLRRRLDSMQQTKTFHIANLDAALTLIEKWVYCMQS